MSAKEFFDILIIKDDENLTVSRWQNKSTKLFEKPVTVGAAPAIAYLPSGDIQELSNCFLDLER